MINLAKRLLKGSLVWQSGRVDGIYAAGPTTQADLCYDIAVDASGNYFMTGTGPSGVGFVAKVPHDLSAVTWQRKQTLTSFACRFMGVDSSGNAYGGGQGAATSQAYVYKYLAAGGAVSWQRKMSNASACVNAGLAVNASGDVYASITTQAATLYGNIAKWNTSGTLQWQRKLSQTYALQTEEIALNPSGDVIVTGHFYDAVNSDTNNRGIVLKLNASDGLIAWQYKIHFSVRTRWYAIAVDSVTGDIIVGGYADIGGASNARGILAKLDSSGTVLWHAVTVADSKSVGGVAVDPVTGDVFVTTAGASNTLDFSCFNSSGTLQWVRGYIAQTQMNGAALKVSNQELLFAGYPSRTGAGQEALLLRLPIKTGGNAGTYGFLTVSAGTTTWTTGSITSAAPGITEAAGSLTEAAGSFTDAAQTLTFTAF